MAHMIDHLVGFSDEARAFTVLSQLVFDGRAIAGRNNEGFMVWDTSRVDPSVKLITADPVLDLTGPSPVLISPEQTIPGFFITIALPSASEELAGLTNNALRVVEDRDKADPTMEFHQYAVTKLTGLPEGLAGDMKANHRKRTGGKVRGLHFQISPRFAGHKYPPALFRV